MRTLYRSLWILLFVILVPLHAEEPAPKPGEELATFGAGCFWCVEAVFDSLEGVKSAVSGYAGGTTRNPSYKQVCTGTTGHAEVVQITFDPKVITYAQLLEVFWKTHDPTTRNQQGADVGTQYRSLILYHNEEQKKTAEALKKDLDASGAWDDPIVTEISPYKVFYMAEVNHQEYYRLNGNQPYCRAVIAPKMKKFEDAFKHRLKKQ